MHQKCIFGGKAAADMWSGALKPIVDHKRIHTGERPYPCNLCKKAFCAPGSLKLHAQIHTGEKPFVCGLCHKGFAQKYYLMKHSRTHTREKPFTCDFCNKSYKYKKNLKVHRTIHVKQEYICDVCDKVSYSKKSLCMHIKNHIVKKILKCCDGPKSFPSAKALKVHSRTHTGETPYASDLCNKTFTTKGNLKKGERPNKNDELGPLDHHSLSLSQPQVSIDFILKAVDLRVEARRREDGGAM